MALSRNMGMLSGDPRGALDPNMYYQRGQKLGAQMGRSLGGMFGRDMRSGEQIAAAEENQYLQAVADPTKTATELFSLSQQAINTGYTEAGGQLLKAAQAAKLLEDEKTSRTKMAERAKSLGLPETAQGLLDKSIDLGDAAKQIQSAELTKMQGKNNRPAREAILTRYGFGSQDDIMIKLKKGELDNMTEEAFTAMVEAEKDVELKPYLQSDGTIAPLPTLGGRVRDPKDGMWKYPHEMDLKTAPQLQKSMDVGKDLTEALLGKGVARFDELSTNADVMKRSLGTLDRLENLLDQGINTGLGANVKNSLVATAVALGLPKETALAQEMSRTQAFVAEQLGNLAAVIRQYGTGQSITEKDVQMAREQIGGDVTQSEKAIRYILKKMRAEAKSTIGHHDKIYQGLKSKGIDPAIMSMFESGVDPDSLFVEFEQPQQNEAVPRQSYTPSSIKYLQQIGVNLNGNTTGTAQ